MKLDLSNDRYNETQLITNQHYHSDEDKTTSEFGVTILCLLENPYILITSAREKVTDIMTNAKA